MDNYNYFINPNMSYRNPHTQNGWGGFQGDRPDQMPGMQFPGQPNFNGPLPMPEHGQGQQFPGYPNFEGSLPGMEYGQGQQFPGYPEL